MNNAPILILQMQRLGDLVLSFPLLARLGTLFPGRPLWVVGEERFFRPLMSLSPRATYFDYAAAPVAPDIRFHLVVNLSHRHEAAVLAGRAKCDELVGPYLDPSADLRIRGDYQLYRASLAHNNRLNRFHWSDLNCLDLVPVRLMQRTVWPKPKAPGPAGLARGARIGLFLGASEPAKHPDAGFWTALAQALLTAGHKPVLLGGEAEKPMGSAVARAMAAPQLDLCGRFSVEELAGFITGLDLLITPDTGPMHVAVWSGTPVLNLSLGPVHAWETGPMAPGHHVLRAGLGCVGCWRCMRSNMDCRDLMAPGKAARMARDLLAGRPASQTRAVGCELLQSGRDSLGRFSLLPLFGPDHPRDALARFWQDFFTELFHPGEGRAEAKTAFTSLAGAHPQTAAGLQEAGRLFAARAARALRPGALGLLRDPDWWRTFPEDVRPLSGLLQMFVQNEDKPTPRALHAIELLAAALT